MLCWWLEITHSRRSYAMSTDQNKAIARRFQEEFNARNWEGCRISDGRIVEHRAMFDTMTLMQQLGVIPAPGHEESGAATAGR
jgi:hypothetical protein